MAIDQSKKEELIQKLNVEYRVVLSYGEGELNPIGEFIVTDIETDGIPQEYSELISGESLAKIVLSNIDDKKTQIVLPVKDFFEICNNIGMKNADKLSTGIGERTLQGIVKDAENKVMENTATDEIINPETISLEESNAQYLINKEIQSSNYSLFPINLGRWRERIKYRYSYSDHAQNGNYKSAPVDYER